MDAAGLVKAGESARVILTSVRIVRIDVDFVAFRQLLDGRLDVPGEWQVAAGTSYMRRDLLQRVIYAQLTRCRLSVAWLAC